MNTDSAFAMGKRHEVCQDYAQAEAGDGWACAFVSDGCSSSRDSDVGSRLMVLSAKQALRAMLDTGWDPETAHPDDIGLIAISGSMLAARMLELPSEALDATLLSLVSDGSRVSMSAYGDGALALVCRSGRREHIDIEFSSGYPDYLSYRIDPDRRAKYDKLDQGGVARITILGGGAPTIEDHRGLESHKAFTEKASCKDLVLAVAMSDGVRSFYRRTGNGANEPVPLGDVLAELLEFKLLTGRFVQRRLNRFLKDAAARGWEHHDDIAVAAIHFGEP